MKAKTVRDAESHTYSEVRYFPCDLWIFVDHLLYDLIQNLYTMAELAQVLIKTRTQTRSWTLQSYPGKIKLPSDILRPLPNPEAVAKVSDIHHPTKYRGGSC